MLATHDAEAKEDLPSDEDTIDCLAPLLPLVQHCTEEHTHGAEEAAVVEKHIRLLNFVEEEVSALTCDTWAVIQ